MKYYLPQLLILSFALILLQGCTMSKLLKQNRTEMERLAYEDLSKKEKFDGLAEVLVEVMESSLTFENPLKTFRYLEKFTKQNSDELKSLSGELKPWIDDMGRGEKISFTTRALARPYSRRMVKLVPRIQRMAKENEFELGPLQKAMLVYRLKGLIK